MTYSASWLLGAASLALLAIALVVSATGERFAADAAAAVAAVSPRPALVLAADGEFPYATGEMGRLLARISSTRGMKSRTGIRPGEFFIFWVSTRIVSVWEHTCPMHRMRFFSS